MTIGKRVIIQAGAAIGGDGFGFVTDGGKHHKIPQVGGVIIEDDVEIGANCTIDRATLGNTLIKKGTKIDNLVQVAHNVTIGEHCLLAGQVRDCRKQHARKLRGARRARREWPTTSTIGDKVMAGGGTAITRDVEPGQVIVGYQRHADQGLAQGAGDLAEAAGAQEVAGQSRKAGAGTARKNIRADKGGEDMIGIQEIMETIPHRYPFLLVDRIVEMEIGKRIVGIKNVTMNEPFFQGHFPGHPIMPGVLLLEAMAQTGGVMAMKTVPPEQVKNKVIYFMSIDKAKFRKPVIPGDQVRFELDVIRQRATIMGFEAKALVDGAVVAEAELMAMIVDK